MPSKPSKLTPSFVVPYQDHLFDLRKKNCWWRIWIDPYRLHQTSSYIITDHRTANMDRIEQIEPQDHQAADMPLSLFQLDSMGIRVTRQQAARNLQNMLLKAFLSNFGHSPKASASMTQDDTRWYFYEHRPSSLRKTWKNTFKRLRTVLRSGCFVATLLAQATPRVKVVDLTQIDTRLPMVAMCNDNIRQCYMFCWFHMFYQHMFWHCHTLSAFELDRKLYIILSPIHTLSHPCPSHRLNIPATSNMTYT